MISKPTDIKRIRQNLGMTQFELAKAAGVSQSLIAKIESGRIDPAYSKVQQIMDALQIFQKKEERTAKDIMVTKIVSVEPEAGITDAIKKMQKHGISQLPVVSSGVAVGLISESAILSTLTEDKPHKKVRDAMKETPPQVPITTTTTAITKILSFFPLVLITDNGKIKGLVTRADVLQKAFE